MGNYMDEENDIDSEEDETGEEENGEIEAHRGSLSIAVRLTG